MKYFGTDGIRQKAEHFTPDFLAKIIKGLIDYAGDEIKVLLGGDTRESTEWILTDLESALETFGVEYSNVGILPTPAINYCFYEMGFDFAIDVTASHNPYEDNGIKIFERGEKNGEKLSEAGCKAIESALSSKENYALIAPTLREDLHDEALELYKDHLKNYLKEANFKNLKVGIDCANGATSVIGDSIFKALGARVELIHANKAYGTKINAECGSTHLESLQALVKENNLDLGIAFDGDGDRCLLVNKNGDVVDGDEIIAILTDYLNLDKIAITVMANQGLLNWTKEKEIEAIITPVGDSNVAAAMREKNIKLGGEQSGHIILPGEPTGDGILTALMVLKAVSETNRSLKSLSRIITKLPQVIVNLKVTKKQKDSLATSEVAKDIISQFEEKVKGTNGRLLVRPSGTENLIRITVWGEDEKIITELANELNNELERSL